MITSGHDYTERSKDTKGTLKGQEQTVRADRERESQDNY